jgi:hypothetical protein
MSVCPVVSINFFIIWRQKMLPKRRCMCTKLHGVIPKDHSFDSHSLTCFMYGTCEISPTSIDPGMIKF